MQIDDILDGFTICDRCGAVIRDFVAGGKDDRCPNCGHKQGCCDGV